MKPIDRTLKVILWQNHKTAIPILTKVKMAIFERLINVVMAMMKTDSIRRGGIASPFGKYIR